MPNKDMMSTGAKSKARQFIASTVDNAKTAEAATLQDMKQLETVVVQYSEAANDYLEARIKYLDLLDKYQSASTEPVFQAFPGITSHLPTYPTEEMAADTAAMRQLAELIHELTRQIEQLEDQMKGTLKRLQTSAYKMAEDVNRTAAYCDQLLVSVDSPYDAGMLASRLADS